MAGTYLEGTSKVLSGVYTLIKSQIAAVAVGARGIVAYPFTANWGPVNKLDTVITGKEFNDNYNAESDKTLTAYKIYEHAFKGKPQRVLAYRAATPDAKKAEATLKAADNTDALVLETLYPTDRPFVAKVSDGLTGGKVIEIIENSRLLDKVEGTTLDDLAAKIALTGTVRVKTKGTQLPANTNGVSFTGGNNGAAITATEYQDFLTEVEADGRANAFTLDAVTDPALQTTAKTWTKRVRDEGLYITYVQGGPATWDSDLNQANTESKACNYRGIINVGNGCDGYTAAEMAIFVAARVASIPLNRSVTDDVVDYRVVNNKKQLTPGNRTKAKEAGTLLFVMEGDTVVIDEGVNTLTAPVADEVKEFGKIRVNNALDQIAKDLEAFGNEYKKTRSNTQEARDTYAATVENTYFRGLQQLEVIQPGYFYRPDPEYHGKDAVFKPKIDEAFFHWEVTPVDSMEKIYQKGNIKF